ncbi:MAG: YesL family protein [Lachnospiraceae bacterium]|nr:YesL family protein [Lachnospiraceae bacterium]
MAQFDNEVPKKQKPRGAQGILWRALDVLGNVFALNVFFVIFSLPIVTIGPSLAALYTMTFRVISGDDAGLFAGYKQAFKDNFKQAFAAWMLFLLACAVLFAENLYVASFSGPMVNVYKVVIVIEVALLCLEMPFLFPVIARFENTFWNNVKNSLLLAISNLGSWLKIFLAWVAPILICLARPQVFFMTWWLFLVLIFGAVAYGTTYTVRKVFDKVSSTQENEEKKEKDLTHKVTHAPGVYEKAMMGAAENASDSDAQEASGYDSDSAAQNPSVE